MPPGQLPGPPRPAPCGAICGINISTILFVPSDDAPRFPFCTLSCHRVVSSSKACQAIGHCRVMGNTGSAHDCRRHTYHSRYHQVLGRCNTPDSGKLPQMLHSRTGPWYGVIEQSISVSVRPAGAPTRPAWVVSAPQRICVTRTIALSLVASLIHTAAYCRGTTLCRYTQAQLPKGIASLLLTPISRSIWDWSRW